MEPTSDLSSRRPLKSRGSGWAKQTAALALRTGLSADAISLIGILFAALGALAFLAAPSRPALYLAAALGIQLRLLANLLDGLVAVEGGRKSPYGALFNEVPDRAEDSLLLIAAGQAAGSLALGLTAALLAAICAYVRLLGGSLGLPQDFGGPMAKPHRMAALTLAALAAALEAATIGGTRALMIALALIAAGTVLTIALRLRRMAILLKAAQ